MCLNLYCVNMPNLTVRDCVNYLTIVLIVLLVQFYVNNFKFRFNILQN